MAHDWIGGWTDYTVTARTNLFGILVCSVHIIVELTSSSPHLRVHHEIPSLDPPCHVRPPRGRESRS
jgi:hypothetical protein